MNNENQFNQIRKECSRMIWTITREIKNHGHATRPYIEALDSLAATVVDDWGGFVGLQGVVTELIQMPSLSLQGDFKGGERWALFVNDVVKLARNAGLDLSDYQDGECNE